MKAIAGCVAVLLMAASAEARQAAPACPTPARTYQDHWCVPIKAIREALAAGALADQAGIERLIRLQGANLGAFLLYAQSRAQAIDMRSLEDARHDKQVGAPGNAAGSTSVVSKGAVPSILGFAVENGALTQSASGTAVTLRGNLVGWLDLIQNQGFIASYQDDGPIVRQLRRVSYSLTLNTETATAPAPSGPGALSPAAIREQLRKTGQQLAGYSVRLAIWDQRDPRVPANRAAVATMLDTQGAAVLKADDFLNVVLNSEEYNFKWIPETATLLNNPTLSEKDLERVLYRQLEAIRLYMITRIDDFDEQVTKALLALEGFDKARLKVFEAMQSRPLVAFEYVNARTKDLPDRSTLRLIAEGKWGPRLDLTGNVAWTIQHAGTVQLPEQRTIEGMRDFQAAAQLEVPLGNREKNLVPGTGIGSPVLGVAYLSQKLTDTAAISFAGTSFTLEPGWIHVVQAKVIVPVKGSGVKIPLSLSWANRTELIKEKTLRGHIGLTFDLDVLSAIRP